MARPANPEPRLKRGYWTVRIAGRDYHLGKDRRAAFAKFHKLMARHLDPVAADRPEQVAGVIERWLRLHPSPKNETWVRPFARDFGQVCLTDVTPDLLHNFHDVLLAARYRQKDFSGRPCGKARPYAQETIRNYTRTAVSIMRLAARRGWCAMPEVPDVKKPRWQDRHVEQDKLWAVLDALPERAGRLLRFVAAAGCRVSEGRLLRWEHVQLARKACVLPRHKTADATGEPRIIRLTDDALNVLAELEPGDGYVFLNRFGKPYTLSGLRSILKRHGHITPDQLRPSFAQTAIDAGAAPETVTRLLGHKTSSMVWTYATIREDRLDEAARSLRVRPAAAAAG